MLSICSKFDAADKKFDVKMVAPSLVEEVVIFTKSAAMKLYGTFPHGEAMKPWSVMGQVMGEALDGLSNLVQYEVK